MQSIMGRAWASGGMWHGSVTTVYVHIKLQLSKSKCRHSLGLGESKPENLSEKVEHVVVSNVAMFAWHLGFEWNTVETVGVVAAYAVVSAYLSLYLNSLSGFQLVSSPAKNRLGMRLGLRCHSFAFTGMSLLWGSLSFTSSLSSVPGTIPLPPLSQSFTLLSLQHVEHCLFRFCAVAPIFLLLHWFDNSSRVAVGIHVLKQLVV